MKKFLALSAAVGALMVAAPASAQNWPVNQRQAQLEQRIDQGVRSGALTRREATTLQAEFNGISQLEARYRVNGLSNWERADLDSRFDSLSSRIRYERNDRQDRGEWQTINQRQRQLDQRIDQGVRNGDLSRREAERLRAEFRQIAALEARYRRNGLNNAERVDLDRRFDRLSAEIRVERRDGDNRRRG